MDEHTNIQCKCKGQAFSRPIAFYDHFGCFLQYEYRIVIIFIFRSEVAVVLVRQFLHNETLID